MEKQCAKATEEKKKGINLLQDDIKVPTLRRAENLRKKHRMKEQARVIIYEDPLNLLNTGTFSLTT